MKPEDYDYMFQLNLRAPVILTELLQEHLKESKGCVVNVSCDKGSRPEAGMLGYCMSKAGLEMHTKTLALMLASYGVRVNAVAPSFVPTNFYRYAGVSDADYGALKNRALKNIPLNRVAKEVEVAKTIIFITSE